MKESLFITPILLDGIGTLNAAVKNMATQMSVEDPKEVLRRINSGEWVVTQPERQWNEKDGIIRFSVTSNGKTGPEWEDYLKKAGHSISQYAHDLLHSDEFVPTNSVTYEIVILKGERYSDDKRSTKNIRKDAETRKLSTPNPEIACLNRDKFSNKEIEQMGLTWIITMHESIKDSDGSPDLLGVRRGGGSWLNANWDDPDNRWNRDNGFVFVASQITSFSLMDYLLGSFLL